MSNNPQKQLVHILLTNGITLLGEELPDSAKVARVSKPLILDRTITDEGELFSLMAYCPYQLEYNLEIPKNQITTKVKLTSEKFTTVYYEYVDAFSKKLAEIDFNRKEYDDDLLEFLTNPDSRTIH